MARSKIYVGLEVGTSKICVVVGEVKNDNSVRIIGVGHVASAGVRKGEIVDIDQARKSLSNAVCEAEEKSDVTIATVIYAITGNHVQSVNNRGSYRIPDDQDAIEIEDLDEVKEISRDFGLPQQNVHLHSIIRQYCVDGQEGISDPIGMTGRKLEADYHIIHGVRTRVQNAIRCIKSLRIEVEDVVFSPIASSLAVLDRESKKRGTLLIDLGGGTSDYVLYEDGQVVLSGCVPIGGDHITSDLSSVLKLQHFRAETIKIEEGNAWPLDGGKEPIELKGDASYSGDAIDRELVNQVIYYRLKEIFELVYNKANQADYLVRISGGVHLTGGVSKTLGIEKVAQQVFEMPIKKTAAAPLSGLSATVENPEYSTAIGLIQYAQVLDAERPNENALGSVKEAFTKLFGKKS